MYKDEKNQPINMDELLIEIKNDREQAPSKDVLEKELATFYLQHQTSELTTFNLEGDKVSAVIESLTLHQLALGKGILEKIRAFICKILSATATTEDIIKAVQKALNAIIPGAGMIKALVLKIVKYILSIGIGKLCPVV